MLVDVKALKETRKKIDEARKAEEKLLGLDEENYREDDRGISPAFIADCFRLNERGDATLFAKINKNRLVYVKQFGCWLHWEGNHWKIDDMNCYIDAVEEVAKCYESYTLRLKDRIVELMEAGRKAEATILNDLAKKYNTRINKLRTLKGAKTCAEYSYQIGKDKSLIIIGPELDQKPMLLACPNAVIDLATGETVEGKPEDYILNAAATEWKGIDEPCPEWEKFFATIHNDDQEVMRLVHAMLGYSITGLRTEHFIGCFIGEGRNGKGTMFETVRAILGDLGWAISPEMLLDQKFGRSSSGPSADLYSLIGKRLVIASETDEKDKISTTMVKRLTGGDTINARAPHEKKEINFTATHKLFLYSQYVPKGLAKDYALYKRLLFITYLLKFVDDPKEPNERARDPDLPAKLEAEASGILAWLVRGCLIWKAEGKLKPPPKVQASIDAVRRQDDIIFQFVEDNMEKADSDISLTFAEVYGKFKEFYTNEISEDLRYLPSKKVFSKWFADHEFEPGKKSGVALIYGIRFKPLG